MEFDIQLLIDVLERKISDCEDDIKKSDKIYNHGYLVDKALKAAYEDVLSVINKIKKTSN